MGGIGQPCSGSSGLRDSLAGDPPPLCRGFDPLPECLCPVLPLLQGSGPGLHCR